MINRLWFFIILISLVVACILNVGINLEGGMGPFAPYFPKWPTKIHKFLQLSTFWPISLRFHSEILSKWPMIFGSRVNPAVNVPISALLRAGESLTPSPVTATICPCRWHPSTMISFCWGDVRANTISEWLHRTSSIWAGVMSLKSIPWITAARASL